MEEHIERNMWLTFLFDVSNEVKHFYETPVIFLTKKDYSDVIFNTMCNIRRAMLSGQKDTDSYVLDTIVDYHLNWLHTVNELETYKKLMDDIPRTEIFEAISFTIDAIGHRLKYFRTYMERYCKDLSNQEQVHLNADVEIVEEMHKDITQILLEKLKCFRNFVSDQEFRLRLKAALEDLLIWLDKIYDGLSKALSKYININVPHLAGDLTKTLQQIVESLSTSKSPSALRLLEELKEKRTQLGSMVRSIAPRNLELMKVVEKINVLEERIHRLEHEPSSAALMALQHKKEYLEKRLASLENLKTNLKHIQDISDIPFEDVSEEDLCVCPDFYQLRIFNHLLPPLERERLVSELCYLWDQAIFGDRSHKSIISILSAAEVKEEFTDDLGTFYIDQHSRKIYKLPDDDTLYQPNERNELVAIADDENHVYFYDECGRYFTDAKSRQRVYKAHASASEYMMDSTGVLLKVKEEREGISYYYDNYGRYYINEQGKQIYRETDTISEYENDGLGNLVRIRSQLDIFEPCPDDVNVTEDFKYLKQNVGQALQVCIADVILRQPADPIKYLSARLMKYRENLELKDKRATELEELLVERNFREAEARAEAERAALEAALLAQGGSEASYDSNLLNYTSSVQEDGIVTPSSKN